MITHLTPAPGTVAPPEFANADHPMRKVTRQVAFEDAWDAVRAAKVAALFDSMAATWTVDHDGPERLASLDDAYGRGDIPAGRCLEIGSGTGLGTRLLAERHDGPVVALDLARDMLRNAPAHYGARVQGDSAALPVADASVDVVVMVNALLFPREVDRVLAADGAVVWVNTVGENTPIHLSPEDVALALPGAWVGPASRAGSGLWAVLRRQQAH